ncbi:MAG: hypothetical protein HC851_24135 [Acaryochloris sp. RU_4_1]|nr:hypothetical protein [Acaryochloris sp. RU_4_1]
MVISADLAIAKPIKNCPPVVRSLKTQKLYCAHELKTLKQNAEEKQAKFLCFLIRAIIPPNDFFKTNQCFPESNFSSATGEKIMPRPKGTKTAFTLLKPLGNMQLTPQPVIAWQPIPNASYRITIEQGGSWLWSHETTATEIKLPRSKSLKPGKLYKLSAVAFQGEQAISGDVTTLQLVDPQQLRKLNDTVLQAQQVAANPLDRGLDKAMMLYHLGLFDAAVIELLALTQYQKPAVYSQLGLIYKEVGDKKIAQGYFDKASELANHKPKPLSRAN